MGFLRFFGRFRRRWGDMEHRPEEPLGQSSGDEQDWSNRTCGIGCELPMLAEWFPMTFENEDEAYYGYGRQEGHAKPNSNQSSRSSTTKQVSQLLLGLVGTLCFKIMIFSPFHKACGGRSPFHKECGGRSPKSATFETMRMLMGKEG